MNDRFSLNGDGHARPHKNRISHTGSQEPAHPDDALPMALRRRYDEIETLWEEAEEDLKRFRIPHTVEYLYSTDDRGHPVYHFFLGFLKYGKQWRICHGFCQDHGFPAGDLPEERNWTPLIECPLDLRLRMMDEFENLHKKVIEVAEKLVPELDERISSFRRILRS
jgi:hypothetical protein